MEAESLHLRRIVPHWNPGLVAASIAISFLGAFTSTQLVVQAKTSRYLSAAIVWSMLASLTFGFCSIWSLHFIATLACELDLPIGLDPSLTILSACLAVVFTWIALASDFIWERYSRLRRRHRAPAITTSKPVSHRGSVRAASISSINSRTQLLPPRSTASPAPFPTSDQPAFKSAPTDQLAVPLLAQQPASILDTDDTVTSDAGWSDARSRDNQSPFGSYHGSRRSSAGTGPSSDPSWGLGRFASIKIKHNSKLDRTNPLVATMTALFDGLTPRNLAKGFVWSLAITGMHFSGILALRVPDGRCTLDLALVALSAVICWVVCVVGCILMASMETRLSQQLLFSLIATSGVAAMHFTGMRAAEFWSTLPPSPDRGYPAGLVTAIFSIAISTCLAANFLLAHSATLARNKLVEIVHTRKNLWAAIAQKENAEAAALARSEFIASASHEIRSPIHQLQGYSDLLARAHLDDESRLLLHAIQDAIRSLSLITTTVLDWSRIENGEAVCRPTAVDVRAVCDSVLNILPSKDEDSDVDLIIAVSPDVPNSLFVDEAYLHRIIMNLLSNALKFTSTGYVMLMIRIEGDNMVVAVKDTGSGIPATFLPDLFEPFKQAQTRGPQRGTGLGLSIVKQLLQKMNGSIETVSKEKDLYPDESGTTFTATFPIQYPTQQTTERRPALNGRLAICGDNESRSLNGIQDAWRLFDVESAVQTGCAAQTQDVPYIWASLEHLRNTPRLLRTLQDDTHRIVLIPFDEEKKVTELIGSSVPQHFVLLNKPLRFHDMVRVIAEHGNAPARGSQLGRMVRFASEVDLLDDSSNTSKQRPDSGFVDGAAVPSTVDSPAPLAKVIMLVEDNKINQRLGAKMLKTLGYSVIIANDGQEAVESLVDHEHQVDAILMDQNMPRKDGLTATREIRAMEADGTLSLRNGKPRPIIAVTAVVGQHAEAMCREAGADDFLPKPLSLAGLRNSLETYLMKDYE